MNVLKIEGIISAIESESKNPAPSHSNLARLVSLLGKALVETDVPTETKTESLNTISVSDNVESPEEPEEVKKSKKKKSSK
jgi:hypothetical protein